MKNIFRISGVILIVLSIFLIHSCKKDKPNPPTVTTTEATEISYTTATLGGNVTNEGGAPILSKGICWNNLENPTIDNSKTLDGTGTGPFASSISQLVPGTKYYVRAYATNNAGTGYGNQVSFTSNTILLATLTTTAIGSINSLSAVSGGNITADGGGAVTERGVCWATTTIPTINNNKTTDGSGTGSFTSNLTNLTANTSYYVRAYATNSMGTAYGEQIQFITLIDYTGQTGTVIDIDGNTYPTIGIGSQFWMAENLKTTKYTNGNLIPTTTPATLNLDVNDFSKYQWAYDGNESNVATYGRLYTLWTVTDIRKICPAGWHIPTLAEWTTLTNFLGGDDAAGGKLKEPGTIHWKSPNTGATNETGFTALPGGGRGYNGSFFAVGLSGYWWSSTGYVYNNGYCQYLDYWQIGGETNYHGSYGFSVRCVKN